MSLPKPTQYQHMVVELADNGVRTLRLNRPAKKNAILDSMMSDLIAALADAARCEHTKFMVITGTGSFFSSGNDLTNFANGKLEEASGEGTLEAASIAGGSRFEAFVRSFINFPKILIALVNGPAIGIMVTLLAICDLVYAVEHATFTTPFAKLGQTPEACSTYTFQRLMGKQKALEMFTLDVSMSAKEAESHGLVTRVFPKETFRKETEEKLKQLASLPFQSILACKKLMLRNRPQAALHEANRAEVEVLVERWTSEDCLQAIIQFFQSKAKL